MDQGEAIIAIIAGSILVIASFFADNFYEASGIPLPIVSDRKIPKWQGRFFFWIVGGAMILMGVVSLFPNH